MDIEVLVVLMGLSAIATGAIMVTLAAVFLIYCYWSRTS